MRFDELTLEGYGAFERRTLHLSPGLNVVFGPNEAGKSTFLLAIRDFLFRIPERSAQLGKFGSDAARIRARLTTASGDVVALVRRCGRVRTLMDGTGAACDDAVLSALLGSVDRVRFATLFGLDHVGLRTGGDALLRADGDVGKLIVEAGGGLRSLITDIDALVVEAAALFAPRRKGGRAFYDALSAFEAAEAAAKADLLTREAYERDLKAHEAAIAELETIRSERRSLGERSSRLRRVERVVPSLRELAGVEAEIANYADVAELAADFPDRCEASLEEFRGVAGRLDGARLRLVTVRDRLDGAVVDEAVVSAERDVRDLKEQAAVVRAARAVRQARAMDAEEADAQLELLRTTLDVGREVDLDGLAPATAKLRALRALGDRDAAISRRLGTARQAVPRAERAVGASEARLAALATSNLDRPFGVDVTALSTLPAERAAAVGRVDAALALEAAAHDRAIGLGMHGVDELRQLPHPTEEQIGAEAEARRVLDVERARAVSTESQAAAEVASVRGEIDALLAGGEPVTPEVLAGARRRRDDAWRPIRSTLLDDAPLPVDRRTAVGHMDASISEADRLADAREAESARVATLTQARRHLSVAEGTLEAAALARTLLGRQRDEMEEAFRAAFPAAHVVRPGLAALLPFSVEARRALTDADAAARERRAGEAGVRRLASTMDLLVAAEREGGLVPPPGADVAGRVRAVLGRATAHDRGHDEHGRELTALARLRDDLADAEREVEDAERERTFWTGEWVVATAALGLPPDAPVDEALELVRLWERARGDLRAVAQARGVLERMDEDEATLGARAAALGGRLATPIPADPLAAADMLAARWDANDAARLGRVAIEPEARAAELDLSACVATSERLERNLAALATEAGATPEASTLGTLASRRRALELLLLRRKALSDALAAAGDGMSPAALRDEAEGRDLDAIRAEAAEVAGRLKACDSGLEQAVAAEVRSGEAVRGHARPTDGAGAVALREAAVADMHDAAERYVELMVAKDLLTRAVGIVRDETQDPLVRAAGTLFAGMTRGEFEGVAADVDGNGTPVVVGVRSGGRGAQASGTMSEGTRDQLFLSFRLASLAAYCAAAEPLPFVLDDVLVHFDDPRAEATLQLLADFAAKTQVLLFTHHRAVRDATLALARDGCANVVDVSARGDAERPHDLPGA